MRSNSLKLQSYGEHATWISYACVFNTEKIHIFATVFREKKKKLYSSTTAFSEFIHNLTFINFYKETILNLKTSGSFIPQHSITHFIFDQASYKVIHLKHSSESWMLFPIRY